ncbi:MAG TPA: zf-HC2 domain-containing protein [Gemmatimonadaceae bacterium]|nr:zf-HC2 domain-containing protein [Gemmatimonadaceae bacterium]
MIDCPNVEMRDRLPDLANESLDPATRALVVAHVEACAACTAEMEIVRSVRLAMVASTPRVNVANIVLALPSYGMGAVPGVVPITAARSARARSWGTWRVAAAVTLLAGGVGSYAVLRTDSPVRTIDSSAILATSPDTSSGLALTGALSYLTADQLDALVKDIDGIEALPSTEVETGASAVSVPMILPDSVVRELEVY